MKSVSARQDVALQALTSMPKPIEIGDLLGGNLLVGKGETSRLAVRFVFKNWRGHDGNDPSVDIAKDADQRF